MFDGNCFESLNFLNYGSVPWFRSALFYFFYYATKPFRNNAGFYVNDRISQQ